MVIKGKEITKEKVIQAMQCNTADELIALAKADGIELTKEEAEAYMAEMADLELDENELKHVAGGVKTCYMISGCAFKCGTLKEC